MRGIDTQRKPMLAGRFMGPRWLRLSLAFLAMLVTKPCKGSDGHVILDWGLADESVTSSRYPGLYRFGAPRLQHARPVTSLAFSPDGKLLASGSLDCTIRLWETGSWRISGALQNGNTAVNSLCFSDDGKVLAAGGSDGTICLWELRTKNELLRLKSHTRPARAIAFWPGRNILVSGGDDGNVRVWDLEGEGRVLASRSHGAPVLSVSVSSSGKLLASGGEDGTLIVWDINSGKRLLEHRASAPIRHVQFSPDGKRIIFGADDIYFITVFLSDSLKRFRGPSGLVHSLNCAPDGRIFAARNGVIEVWDTTTGKWIKELRPHKGIKDCPGADLQSVRVSPDGRFLAVCGSNCQVQLWDLKVQKGILNWEIDLPISGIACPANRHLFAWSKSGDWIHRLGREHNSSVFVWEPAIHKEVFKLSEKKVISGFQFISDSKGQLAAIASCGNCIQVWNVTDNKIVYTFLLPNDVEACEVSSDAKLVAAACRGAKDDNHVVFVWRLDTGNRVHQLVVRSSKLIAYTSRVNPFAIAFSPDADRLVFSGNDGLIHQWRVVNGDELPVMNGHETVVHCVNFSPDGKLLASASGGMGPLHGEKYDNAIRLWDLESGKELTKISGHTDLVTSVAFSPDSRMILSCSWDNTIRLWEITSGKEVLKISIKNVGASRVFFIPNKLSIASIMQDGGAFIWNVESLLQAGFKPIEAENDKLDRCWHDLASTDVVRAFRATRRLVAAKEGAVTFLGNRLTPIKTEDSGRIHLLALKLDNDDYSVREAATKELERLGSQVSPILKTVLAETASEEVRQRIKVTLKRINSWVLDDAETLQTVRAVWVLQGIGTPGAEAILRKLARGAWDARPTQEAKTALIYLARRRPLSHKEVP